MKLALGLLVVIAAGAAELTVAQRNDACFAVRGQRSAEIVAEMHRAIADPVVRNRGTIGGALCQADPSEDLSAVCAAVDARMVIRNSGGERIVTDGQYKLQRNAPVAVSSPPAAAVAGSSS